MNEKIFFKGSMYYVEERYIGYVNISSKPNGRGQKLTVSESEVEPVKDRFEVPVGIVENIKNFFADVASGLSAYEILEVQRTSEYPSDAHLYMVLAKNKDVYQIFNWNDEKRAMLQGRSANTLDGAKAFLDDKFKRALF